MRCVCISVVDGIRSFGHQGPHWLSLSRVTAEELLASILSFEEGIQVNTNKGKLPYAKT